MRILLIVLVAASLVRGETAPASDAPPAQGQVAATRDESHAEVDLDFSDDIPARSSKRHGIGKGAGTGLSVSDSAPTPASASALAPSSRTWIYWTLGLSAMAGGLTWYLHWGLADPLDPNRTEQVFTDDPG